MPLTNNVLSPPSHRQTTFSTTTTSTNTPHDHDQHHSPLNRTANGYHQPTTPPTSITTPSFATSPMYPSRKRWSYRRSWSNSSSTHSLWHGIFVIFFIAIFIILNASFGSNFTIPSFISSTSFRIEHSALRSLSDPTHLNQPLDLYIVAPLLPMTTSKSVSTRQARAVYSWTKLKGVRTHIYFATENEKDVRDLKQRMTSLPWTNMNRISILRGIEYKEFKDNTTGIRRLPVLADMMKSLQDKASSKRSLFMYINSDIMVFDELVEAARFAARLAQYKKFFLCGTRHEMVIDDILNEKEFSLRSLRMMAKKKGVSRGKWYVDYFVFGQGAWKSVPRFVIGRPFFDDWLVANGAGISIDASPGVMALHQAHNYVHAGAKIAKILPNFESPIIEGDNSGKEYNQQVLENEAAGTKISRGVFHSGLNKLCLKLNQTVDGKFCLYQDRRCYRSFGTKYTRFPNSFACVKCQNVDESGDELFDDAECPPFRANITGKWTGGISFNMYVTGWEGVQDAGTVVEIDIPKGCRYKSEFWNANAESINDNSTVRFNTTTYDWEFGMVLHKPTDDTPDEYCLPKAAKSINGISCVKNSTRGVVVAS